MAKIRSSLNKTIELSDEERSAPVPQFEEASLRKSTIVCGDVRTILDQLPPEYFQLAIIDPPYNIGRDFGTWDDRLSDQAYRAFVAEWLPKISRTLAPSATLYLCCSWGYSGYFQNALIEAGFTIQNRITWKREKGRGASRNWKQNMEDIWFATKHSTEFTFNLDSVKVRKSVIAPYRKDGVPKDWVEDISGERYRMTHPSNIWTDLVVPFWSMPENTDHPTQKPEALVERLIRASSNPGDRILDLFSGSGTTSVVAKRLGREFLGIESNADYVRLGHKRLARESSPRTL